MADMTVVLWTVAIVAAIAYLAACGAAAWRAGRDRRARAIWLAVSLPATPLPAVIAMIRRRNRLRKQAAGKGIIRCPHCWDVVDRSELVSGPPMLCPRCGLAIDEVHLA